MVIQNQKWYGEHFGIITNKLFMIYLDNKKLYT